MSAFILTPSPNLQNPFILRNGSLNVAPSLSSRTCIAGARVGAAPLRRPRVRMCADGTQDQSDSIPPSEDSPGKRPTGGEPGNDEGSDAIGAWITRTNSAPTGADEGPVSSTSNSSRSSPKQNDHRSGRVRDQWVGDRERGGGRRRTRGPGPGGPIGAGARGVNRSSAMWKGGDKGPDDEFSSGLRPRLSRGGSQSGRRGGRGRYVSTERRGGGQDRVFNIVRRGSREGSQPDNGSIGRKSEDGREDGEVDASSSSQFRTRRDSKFANVAKSQQRRGGHFSEETEEPDASLDEDVAVLPTVRIEKRGPQSDTSGEVDGSESERASPNDGVLDVLAGSVDGGTDQDVLDYAPDVDADIDGGFFSRYRSSKTSDFDSAISSHDLGEEGKDTGRSGYQGSGDDARMKADNNQDEDEPETGNFRLVDKVLGKLNSGRDDQPLIGEKKGRYADRGIVGGSLLGRARFGKTLETSSNRTDDEQVSGSDGETEGESDVANGDNGSTPTGFAALNDIARRGGTSKTRNDFSRGRRAKSNPSGESPSQRRSSAGDLGKKSSDFGLPRGRELLTQLGNANDDTEAVRREGDGDLSEDKVKDRDSPIESGVRPFSRRGRSSLFLLDEEEEGTGASDRSARNSREKYTKHRRFSARTRKRSGTARPVLEPPAEWDTMSDGEILSLRSQPGSLAPRLYSSSSSLSDCVSCSGSGLRDCPVCEAEGWLDPPPSDVEEFDKLPYSIRAVWERPGLVVDRNGRAQCPCCNGIGRAFCLSCEGSGSRERKGFDFEGERDIVFNRVYEDDLDDSEIEWNIYQDEDGDEAGDGSVDVFTAFDEEVEDGDVDDLSDLEEDVGDDEDDSDLDYVLYEGDGDLDSIFGLGYDDDEEEEEDDDDDDVDIDIESLAVEGVDEVDDVEDDVEDDGEEIDITVEEDVEDDGGVFEDDEDELFDELEESEVGSFESETTSNADR